MQYLLNKILKNKKMALVIITSTVLMPLLVIISRTAMVDVTLVIFTTLTWLCFFIATESSIDKDRKWYYLAWICLGVTFFAGDTTNIDKAGWMVILFILS
jgi:4-amino-4-deoxy-L-arabinose transferase-like glycosyltransferase